MPPLQSLNKKKINWKTEVWQKIPETFHFQRELRCLYSCPFPWKVIITFIVSPSPAEGGHMRTPFCIRKLQFHSPLSPIPFTSPWLLLACTLGHPSMVPTLPTLICGDHGNSLWKMIQKSDTSLNTSPAELAMQPHKHLPYSNSKRDTKALETYWGSSTAAKWKSQVISIGFPLRRKFKPPPIHPTRLLQSLIWLLAHQLLNCCMLQLCMFRKNRIQCQFSTVQQTVKLAARSTAAPQEAKPSLEWGSGTPFSHLPSS